MSKTSKENTVQSKCVVRVWLSKSQADGSPPRVNGDIVIQWEWSNFDPSQNSNPLTDYDKTLHNVLSPRDEHGAKYL